MNYPLGTLDLVKVKDALYNWVYSVTGQYLEPEQIIWRNQSQALPARPVVTMKIIDGPKPVARNGNLSNGSAPKTFNVGMQHTAVISIQVFGSSKVPEFQPLQVAVDLCSSLTDHVILDELRVHGISIQDPGEVRNITALEETEYEERGQFDISIGLAQNISSKPSTIESVQGTGTVSGNSVPVQVTGI